jgi:starvation-inducible DNA-binding protein
MNEELVNALNKVLGDSFLTYFKAHAGHWNIETRSFYADHTFLESIYSEIYESIDSTAEWLRKIGAYAPTSLASLITYASVTEETNVVSSMGIFTSLESSNNTVLVSLMRAYKLSEAAGELGLSNFLQDRIAAHQKHAWMLKSTLK